MMALGSLAFVQPLMLAALILLPAIWWLLRYTPPRPHREVFPPTRILREIVPTEESRATSPWWLTLLRMIIAALVILALARPLYDPAPPSLTGDGPLLVIVDNGWGAQNNRERQLETADALLAEASQNDRLVQVVETARPAPIPPFSGLAEARERLAAITAQSHAPNRAGLITPLTAFATAQPPGEIIWLSDGVNYADAGAFEQQLAALFPDARYRRFDPPQDTQPLVVSKVAVQGATISGELSRIHDYASSTVTIEALDARGEAIDSQDVSFAGGDIAAEFTMTLPIALRNDVNRLRIRDEQHAGAVRLLDDRLKRPVAGLLSGASADIAQPLLDPLHYVRSALAPVADIRNSASATTPEQIKDLIDAKVDAVVMADIGNLGDDQIAILDQWVREGGLIIRFAGPRLANGADSLLPVVVRSGERVLGGPLSWSEPQGVGGMKEDSPLGSIRLPDDVIVERQILAEPGRNLADATWVWLEDGTPLVTGAQRGSGMIVLFHVTADARWSNLSLSGFFAQLMARIIDPDFIETQATNTETASDSLRPIYLLNASGELENAPGDTRPLPMNYSGTGTADHLPGIYGNEEKARAVNALTNDTVIAPLDPAPGGVQQPYPQDSSFELTGHTFLIALLLLLVDTVAVILLGGFGELKRRLSPAAILLCVLTLPTDTLAQEAESAEGQIDAARAIEVLGQTSLAYVITGDRALDEISRAGILGLSRQLSRRTAYEPGPPVGVDLETDELAFFTLIYWPISADAPPVSEAAISRIDSFMKKGGTVLFDTRDQLESSVRTGASTNARRLAALVGGLDLPDIEPVPPDHVLGKAFYLLSDFPGRHQGAPLWVERLPPAEERSGRPARGGDGVSPLLITGNDFAGAWATDDRDQPLFPVSPGGERQREFSYRVGINIVMYTLTGNYKADQVHVPALIERLGQ